MGLNCLTGHTLFSCLVQLQEADLFKVRVPFFRYFEPTWKIMIITFLKVLYPTISGLNALYKHLLALSKKKSTLNLIINNKWTKTTNHQGTQKYDLVKKITDNYCWLLTISVIYEIQKYLLMRPHKDDIVTMSGWEAFWMHVTFFLLCIEIILITLSKYSWH